ncbi:pilus assembly protein [uncultured Pseudoteredinibacter sp.]|uniref:pilus assembly PilX family protein n=1 Tax=uncultured Pseudoteredinibacter sp. TaxID=1641701 RepID=UPI0026375189|nr:pilus assembly protein [uncultured Pseudoteredinibacter sp.]
MIVQKRFPGLGWGELPVKQKGVTLIVALVVLLVMSVVAIASMSSSTLQARMASNERQMQVSLHAAEAGSRAALLYLQTNANNPYLRFKDVSKGLYSNTANSEEYFYETISVDDNFADYHDPSSWKNSNSVEVSAADLKLPMTAKNPRYIIEFLGEQELGRSVKELDKKGAKSKPVFHYRIISIGWAQDPQVYSIVQTTYKTAESF